ncbi:MAG: helix-turn-helix transcriptional regulator [Bacillota bacterium]|nr:helix-turn-helix transcriptional regulator [Bacillota bacterium]
MAFNYKPLWKLLIDKKMKKTDLVVQLGIGKSTLSKMSKDKNVSMEILDRICNHFECRLPDVVEHIQK